MGGDGSLQALVDEDLVAFGVGELGGLGGAVNKNAC
jgi:hypothetical protein